MEERQTDTDTHIQTNIQTHMLIDTHAHLSFPVPHWDMPREKRKVSLGS